MTTPRLGSRLDADDSLLMGTPSAPQSSPKAHIWDMLRVFAAFMTIVMARGQTDRARFWGILGVGVLILIIGIYRPVIAAFQRFSVRGNDKGVARRFGQEFRRITLDAGHFVNSDPAYTDTLAAALNNVNQRLSSQPSHSLFLALSRIPNMQIFMDRWYCFNVRIHRDSLSAEQFHAAVDELIDILRSYTSYCTTPIFHTFANEYREVLMASEKSHFNAFQQSYSAYLERVATFVDRLNDDFRGLPELSGKIAMPKPL